MYIELSGLAVKGAAGVTIDGEGKVQVTDLALGADFEGAVIHLGTIQKLQNLKNRQYSNKYHYLFSDICLQLGNVSEISLTIIHDIPCLNMI